MSWTAVLAGFIVATVLAVAICGGVMDCRCRHCHAWGSRHRVLLPGLW